MNTKTPNKLVQGSEDIPPPPMHHSKFCPFFLCLGWVFVGLGFVGAFVPGLPTTVFLIVALWAFSRSSDRLRMWLWTHPRFGATLRDSANCQSGCCGVDDVQYCYRCGHRAILAGSCNTCDRFGAYRSVDYFP